MGRQALLTLAQLDRLLRDFFLETYHRRVRGETQMEDNIRQLRDRLKRLPARATRSAKK